MVEWALVFQVSVRCTAFLSVIGSAYLLWLCARMTRRSLLAKQVMHLAFANLLAFLWKTVFPFTEQHCDMEEKVFKYLIGVSITTDVWIAGSTLAAVCRCTCVATMMEKHSLVSLLSCWPFAVILLLPYLMSNAEYNREIGLCVESQAQCMNEMIAGFCFIPAVFGPYLITFCRARQQSPHSVARAYLRATLGLMTTALLTYIPFLVSLVYEVQRQGAADSFVPRYRLVYMIGQIALCSNGVMCTLAYGIQRMRCCGEGEKGIFTVAYGENVEVFDISRLGMTSVSSPSSKGEESEQGQLSTAGRSVPTSSLLEP